MTSLIFLRVGQPLNVTLKRFMEKINRQFRVVIIDDCEIDLIIFRSVLQKLGLTEVKTFQFPADCFEYLKALEI